MLALGIVAITLVGSALGDNMDHCLGNETCMTLQQSSMGDCQCNETMTCCMIDENMTQDSCYKAEMNQNASTAQERLKCADYWLEKSIELHKLHMEDPSTANNKSQMELMKQMVYAHECIIGKNVTIEGMNCTATDHASVNSTSAALARLNCTDFWLEQAIKLHEVHLKYPSTATNESQMKMMEQMMNAHECIMGKSTGMEITDQARMDCASASLEMAMKMNELHMREHCTMANGSQMKVMEQMMMHMTQSNEYMTGENTTMGMNKTIMEMTVPERMAYAGTSLKMAMEMHELHIREHNMDTNESQIKMMELTMEHMMNAYELMTRENMTSGRMNNTTEVKFSGEYKCGC